MNIFIIGSIINDCQTLLFMDTANKIGQALGNSEHSVIVCSYHPSSLDYYILCGIAQSNEKNTLDKIIIYHPNNTIIKREWRDTINQLGITSPQFQEQNAPSITIKDNKIQFDENLKLSFFILPNQSIRKLRYCYNTWR